jgi:hypothetical protein
LGIAAPIAVVLAIWRLSTLFLSAVVVLMTSATSSRLVRRATEAKVLTSWKVGLWNNPIFASYASREFAESLGRHWSGNWHLLDLQPGCN